MTVFTHDQKPTDFSTLKNQFGVLPTNVDGMTERLGYFLVIEVKRGEPTRRGQRLMLTQLAAQPKFLVLVVHSDYEETANGGLEFLPRSFQFVNPDGYGIENETTPEDFARRYEQWYRFPSQGMKAFFTL